MQIILKRDSRLFHFQNHFGSINFFEPTLEVDAGFLDVQPVGDVSCTCYSADKCKSGETGKRYDHTWLWARMVQGGKTSGSGAAPQDAFAMAVKGQKVIPTGELDDSAGYFQCELGRYDFFTNVKSAIQTQWNRGIKRPVACGTLWYQEWQDVTILPMGKTVVSAHEWVICGWDEEHKNMFKIDTHQGDYKYIPQEVFNAAMDATYGSVALTLAETSDEMIEVLKNTKVSLVQRALDICFNLLQIIRAKLKSQSPIPPTPEVKDNIKDTIKDIEEFPRYQWDTIEHIRKSIRIICDEEKLTLKQKDMACDICSCESGFNPKVRGRVDERDRGLFQWNSRWWPNITDEMAFNPETATRLACKEILHGKPAVTWQASMSCWNKSGKYNSLV